MDNIAFKIRRDFVLDSNVNFIKNVEKRYNAVIKRSIATSAKFKTPSLYSDDSMHNYNNKRLRILDFDLNKKDSQSEKDNYGRSNTATNFENKNNLLLNSDKNNLLLENDLQGNPNLYTNLGDKFNSKSNREQNYTKNNLFNEDDIRKNDFIKSK